jgi:DNA-binding NarL/FixJ family response regulator
VSVNARRLRVLVVDDHDVVHFGFRVLLGGQPWVERCLTARSGSEAVELARRTQPHVALVDLFLSGESGAEVCAAIRAASERTRAVQMVGLGMTLFPPRARQPTTLLSEREREVLEAIAAGSTNREIAQSLYLSPHTVKEHTSALYRKLGARNRAEAVQRAQRLGLLA